MKSKQIVVKSLNAAIEKANAKPQARKVVNLHHEAQRNGRELGKALIALRKKLGVVKSCKGWFSEFLKKHNIPRATAYYSINEANGKNAKKRAHRRAKKVVVHSITPYEAFRKSLMPAKASTVRVKLIQLWNSFHFTEPLWIGKKPAASVRTVQPAVATA